MTLLVGFRWSRELFLLFALAIVVSPARAEPPMSGRVAIVIGNANYPQELLPSVQKSAAAMGETLRARGFSTVEARDASVGQMRAALARALASLNGRRGVGVFFFAGYGVQFNGHNYLIPVNAKISSSNDIADESMDVQEVLEGFKSTGSRINVVILDACRNGPFTPVASGKGLAQIDAPPGMFLAYAAGPGNVGTGELYSRSLVEEFQRPEVKLEDAFNRSRVRVRLGSNGMQTPWESTSLEDNLFLEPNGQSRILATRQAAATPEMEDWERSRSSSRDIRAFLLRHPTGLLNEIARLQLEQLERDGIVQQSEAMPERFVAGDSLFAGHFVRDPGNTGFSGDGQVLFKNGDIYDGGMVRNRRHGRGTMIWSNGQSYAGQWRDGRPTGLGVLWFVDGARYDGAVIDGVPNGHGVYTWTDDRRVEADWIQGQANGVGDVRFSNGDIYHGDLSMGAPTGQGRIAYATGDACQGSFRNGVPEGQAACKWVNGDRFEGQFRNGLKDGHGVMFWPNGDRYEGRFLNGLREGPGSMTWANGDRWDGLFRADQQLEGQTVRGGEKPFFP